MATSYDLSPQALAALAVQAARYDDFEERLYDWYARRPDELADEEGYPLHPRRFDEKTGYPAYYRPED